MPKCEDCGEPKKKLCQGERRLCRKCKDRSLSITTKMASTRDSGAEIESGDAKLDSIQLTLQQLTLKMSKLDTFEDKLEDMRKCVEYVSNFFDNFTEQIDDLRRENTDLRHQLNTAYNEINDLQQYTRRNNIEISGIDEKQDEDTDKIVMSVAAAVGVNISQSDIDISHRLPRRSDQANKPSPIIVRFTRRTVRNKIYQQRKHLRTNPTKIIGNTNTNSVYINENLSPFNKRLFYLTNCRRKEANYKFIWTNNGKIFTRKSPGETAVHIATHKDIDKIK